MTDEDSIELDTDGQICLPVVELLTGRGFITGKTGSGKSNSASVVVEELLDRGLPVLIVDTDGEYWGLKEQYEVLHVGADEECELQVGPEHAGKIAELALEDSVPIILDVSGYLDSDVADDLIRRTANALFDKEKTLNRPFLMLVEEIHEYIPQQGGLDETGQMLVRIAKRGRKRGLGLVGISQRPADVKKDFITQCDWICWHRLTWDNDTEVVRRVVDRGTANAVQELADGECFLQADFLEADVQRVQVRRKRTFDAGATPDLDDYERPELKSVSSDLVGELEEITEKEQQRQDRIAQLERALENKEETIATLQDELERARDMSDMAEQFSQALMSSAGGEDGEALQEKVAEIREEKNARIAELEQENEALRDDLRDRREEAAELRERVAELEEYEQAIAHMDELREGVERMSEALGMDAGGGDDRLRKRLETKEERIQELEREIDERQPGASTVEGDETLTDLLQHEAVQAAVDTAKERCDYAAENFDPVLSVLATAGEPLSASEVATPLPVSDSTVRGVLQSLHAAGVVQKEGKQPAKYGIDESFIQQRIEVARKQAELAE